MVKRNENINQKIQTNIYSTTIIEDNIYTENILNKIDDTKKKELIYTLSQELDICENDKQPLIEKINLLRQAVNIEEDQSNEVSAFEGASNYRDPLTSTHVKTITSMLTRTLISDPIYIISLLFNKEYERWLNECFAYCLKNDLKIEEKLREVIRLCIVEFISFVEVIDYVDEYDYVTEETFTSPLEFSQRYPAYTSLNMKDPKEYTKLKSKLDQQLRQYKEAKITIAQRVKETKIDLNVINVNDMYILPWDSCNLNVAKGILTRYEKTAADLREMARIGFFDEEATEEVLRMERGRNEEDYSSYEDLKDQRNYTESDDYQNKPYNIYIGVYRTSLEKDEDQEYYIYFARESRKLLRIERYCRTRNSRNIVGFSIAPEYNSIIGGCVVKDLDHIQALSDTLWNQLIDNNTFANIPMYTISTEELADPNSTFYEVRAYPNVEVQPGKVFKMKNADAFRQMPLSTLNMSAMFNLINLAQRSAEVNTGATQMMSGRESPSDPTAPARKTELQIGQSTLRMDDYVKNLRPFFNILGNILLFKYFTKQPRVWKNFTTAFLREQIETQNFEDQVIMNPQELDLRDIIVDIRSQSVTFNKDSINQQNLMVMSTLLNIPPIQQNPKAMYTLINRWLENLGYSRKEMDDILFGLKQAVIQIDQQQQRTEAQRAQGVMQGVQGPPRLPGVVEEAARTQGERIER